MSLAGPSDDESAEGRGREVWQAGVKGPKPHVCGRLTCFLHMRARAERVYK